jgi:hypothetical protein
MQEKLVWYLAPGLVWSEWGLLSAGPSRATCPLLARSALRQVVREVRPHYATERLDRTAMNDTWMSRRVLPSVYTSKSQRQNRAQGLVSLS